MTSGPNELHELDEIDRKIIELLTRNGRATNQQIARKLNLAAATVSARIRRLEEADAMRVVAVSDFKAFGLNALMAVGVEVEGRPAEDVAADLATLPEVFSAHLVTGRYDIELLVALRSMDDLPDFLLAKVSQIAGIRSLDPSIAVDVIRYEFDVAPMASGGQLMNGIQLDELDLRLIELLSRDARVSNRRIAADLGVTEGTIRGRIKRLQQENLIRFTAITNTAYLGSPQLVFLGIQVEQSRVQEVARQIADFPPINCVIITLGRFHILAIGLFRDLDEVLDVANNKMRQVEGVRHVETSVAVKTMKYNDRMARITRSIEIEDDEDDEE